MPTTDQQASRTSNPVRAVRATIDDPFADRDDLATVVDAALGDLLYRLDDAGDSIAGNLAAPDTIVALVAVGNDLAAFRDAMRDLFRRHRHAVEPQPDLVPDFEMVPLGEVAIDDHLWFPTGDQWDRVTSIHPSVDEGYFCIHSQGGFMLHGAPNHVVRRAKANHPEFGF